MIAEPDWTARWAARVEARRRQVEAITGQGGTRDYWGQRAALFDRMTRPCGVSVDPLVHHVASLLASGGTVLDVGAGTGRHAIPLARMARMVTAVEPADHMRAILEQRAADEGLGNVRLIAAMWEDAVVEPHDIVLASHVLYPIADVGPFLRKLNDHARHYCVVAIRVEPSTMGLAPLWQQVWGEQPQHEPTFIDLYNVLCSMGIIADVRITQAAMAFSSFDDALLNVRQQLFLPVDNAHSDDALRAYLMVALIQRGDRWTYRQPHRVAIVTWQPFGGAELKG